MNKIFLTISLVFGILLSAWSQCSNVNLVNARPQTAAFSDVNGSLTEAWRAFDGGDVAGQTRWGTSDGLVHYVGVDLGQAYNICTVYLEMGGFDYAADFKIQGSNDMAAWTDLISVTGNTQSYLAVDNFPTTGYYRYVRLYVTNRGPNSSGYSIFKMDIYNRVGNDPPSVTLTAPAIGASYMFGTTIEISSTAGDVNGSVSKVEYYQGSTKLGEDATAPYTFSWTNAGVGAYDVFAKAIDNEGSFTWTDPVHITVTNPPASLRNWTVTGNNIVNSNAGFVAIGGYPSQSITDTSIKFAVKGTIYAKKLTVTQSIWADYVFDHNYRLLPLTEVERFIQKNKHLPDIPATKDVTVNGLDVGNNQALLLRKIEELTLYIIASTKKIQAQGKKIDAQEVEIRKLRKDFFTR